MQRSSIAENVLKKRAKLYAVAARSLWTAKRQRPDEWAAENRFYGPETGIPGARDPRLTPYVIPFVRAFDDSRYRRVVLITSAQAGKTDSLLDIIGERLDNRPAPILYVAPSKEFATDQFEPRLVELLRQSPSLAGKVLGGLDSKRQKKTLKRIAGARVRLTHAGSSTALKSDPAAIALVDEYDELLRDVKRQGDPLGLVEARGYTFADFKTGVTSTPSVGSIDVKKDEHSGLEFWGPAPAEDLESPIWKLWQEGTRHHWCWPCIHCSEYFVPRFSCLKWVQPADGTKTSPSEARRTAFVECPNCGGVLEEHDKAEMNARGRYVAPGQSVDADGNVIGDPPETSTISFWVSGLASPFVTFGQRAEDYLNAVRLADPERIRTAINTGFGECFAGGGGEAPEWAEVAAHKSEYARGELPAGVVYLVLTVDVQTNRLVYVLRGWGARATSWLIDYGVLHGETVEAPVWDDLADLIQTPICGIPIKLVLIDSGFRPGKRIELPLNRVYEFCRRFPRHVRPTKGSSFPMRVPLVASKIEVTTKGKIAKYGLNLLRLDTDHWKSWVHERVRWPVDQPGAWYLPHDVTDDYCAQIVSEARIRLPSGRVQWVQRSKENHYLDCEAMQAAASHLLNAQRISSEGRASPPRPPAPPTAEPGVEPIPVAAAQPSFLADKYQGPAGIHREPWLSPTRDRWWNR
jgi:phage terminase large subunit GpA-like protein